MKSKLRRKIWNFWPPFFFTGIKIVKISEDYRHFVVQLKLHFWSANYMGTQYGGSIFSMTDPFYVMILIFNLGPDYIVWDKSATINYLKPGRTTLFAEFIVTEAELNEIRSTLETERTLDWSRKIEIKDANGLVVAEVNKVIYIRKK